MEAKLILFKTILDISLIPLVSLKMLYEYTTIQIDVSKSLVIYIYIKLYHASDKDKIFLKIREKRGTLKYKNTII